MEIPDIFIKNNQDNIKKGTLIGLMGSRGASTGIHFHIEVSAVDCSDKNDRPFIESCRLLEKILFTNSGDIDLSIDDIQGIYYSCNHTKDWDLSKICRDYENMIRIPHGIQYLGKNKISKMLSNGHALYPKTYYNVDYFLNL